MVWWILAACTTPSSDDRATDSTPTPPVPTTPPTTAPTDTDLPPPPVPLLDEALDARCPVPKPGDPFPPGGDLHRVTLEGALGHCNDGSPPVLYVRAATDPAHAGDWVWIFDGGNDCTNYEGCAVRWCGESPPYGARHMSSTLFPVTRGGEGITTQLPDNVYRGWNQVFATYCSSDQWLGARGEYVFDEGDPDYRLFFEGALVAQDGITAGVAGLVSDDGLQTMASLADASNVVVVGISAGCHGAVQNRNTIAAAAPFAETTTVLDSTFYAAAEVMNPAVVDLFETMHQDIWESAAEPAWGAVTQAACAADYPTELWRCLNVETATRNGYVEGRILWHHDLQDPVVYKYYGAAGISPQSYAQLGVDTFRLYEGIEPQVSLHADDCAQHTAIDSDGSFWGFTVTDAEHGGPALTLQDALTSFLAGERVVVVDNVAGTGSTCQ